MISKDFFFFLSIPLHEKKRTRLIELDVAEGCSDYAKKRRLTFVAICFLLFPFTALTAKSSTNNWRPAMKWTRLENVILSYQTISRLWVFADNWTFSSTKQKIIALRMKKHTSKKKRLHVNSRHLVRMLMIQVCNWNDGAAERAAWSDFADGSWWSEVVD